MSRVNFRIIGKSKEFCPNTFGKLFKASFEQVCASDASVEKYISDSTQVIDLNGQMVTPGLMDGHLHAPGVWIDKLYNIDLSEYKTNEEYLKTIKAYVEANPDLTYYEGTPFLLNAYQQEDGSNPGPQKADLDAICSDKPVIIHDASLHAIWVNSAALALAGITQDTPVCFSASA